jgi:hypothetical protein
MSAGPAGATIRFERATVPLISLRLATGVSTEARLSVEADQAAAEDRYAVVIDLVSGLLALGVRGPGRLVAVAESERERLAGTIKALLAL